MYAVYLSGMTEINNIQMHSARITFSIPFNLPRKLLNASSEVGNYF